jgi:hypothetical protein
VLESIHNSDSWQLSLVHVPILIALVNTLSKIMACSIPLITGVPGDGLRRSAIVLDWVDRGVNACDGQNNIGISELLGIKPK